MQRMKVRGSVESEEETEQMRSQVIERWRQRREDIDERGREVQRERHPAYMREQRSSERDVQRQERIRR